MIRKSANALALIIFLLVGLIIGSFIGDLLGESISLLSFGKRIGLDPFVLDLAFLKLTFGLEFTMNMASALGLILALVIYKRF